MDITPQNFSSPARDHYIQSKGHSVEALYTVLADQGFYAVSEREILTRGGSHFIRHPTRKVRGIEHNTGALGHGLAIAVGLALAAKMDNRPHRVYTLLGDGELAEGSVWEASLTAAHYQLDNLVVIIDRNRLQISGSTEEVMALEPLPEKFVAFGYAVQGVKGNDIDALVNILEQPPFVPGKPNLIVAETIKGSGVSFMQNSVTWHHHVPSAEELARIARVGCCRVGPSLISRCGSAIMTMGRANLDEFGATLLALGQENPDLLVVTSDSRGSGKLTPFGKTLPRQLVEVGIAEQNT